MVMHEYTKLLKSQILQFNVINVFFYQDPGNYMFKNGYGGEAHCTREGCS